MQRHTQRGINGALADFGDITHSQRLTIGRFSFKRNPRDTFCGNQVCIDFHQHITVIIRQTPGGELGVSRRNHIANFYSGEPSTCQRIRVCTDKNFFIYRTVDFRFFGTRHIGQPDL